MMLKALYWLLSNDAGVRALVGNRIYPLVAPQDREKPLLVYQTVSTARGYEQDGADGLVRQRVQITVVAESVETARTTAQALRNCLSGYQGTINGIKIYLIALENEYDIAPNAESNLRVARMDYQIYWKEA